VSTMTTSRPVFAASFKADFARRLSLPIDQHRHVYTGAQGLQLVDRSRSLQVGGHQQRPPALFLEHLGELPGSGGLSRPLQADHEDHKGWGCLGETYCLRPERGHQFLMDDLDDLLARCDRLGDILAHGPLFDAGEERLDHDHVDIGLEQGESHLAQRGVDVLLGQLALAPQCREDGLEPLRQSVEHRRLGYGLWDSK
jgi:hypothetical protein